VYGKDDNEGMRLVKLRWTFSYKVNKVDKVWTPYDALIFKDWADIRNES
jgi:hypothetical protein